MNRRFSKNALEDLIFLKRNHPLLAKKVGDLLDDIENDPYRGIGKPEPLRNELAGYWSRRINQEHRLIYRIDGDNIIIIACRYHYKK